MVSFSVLVVLSILSRERASSAIAGLMLMHHGFKDIAFKKEDSYTKKDLIKDLIISILYTLMMVFFIKIGLLKSPLDY